MTAPLTADYLAALIGRHKRDDDPKYSDPAFCVWCGLAWPCLTSRLAADLAHARERIAELESSVEHARNLLYDVAGQRDRLGEDRAQLKYAIASAIQILRQPPIRNRDRHYAIELLEEALADIHRRDDERAAALAAPVAERVPAEGEGC